METKQKEINAKLVDISTQYSKFSKNQVLTEEQLNGFLDYFDDQDRLSRTSLSGVGIACGFQVICNPDKSITVTQGRGVTTDGDLVALQSPSITEEGKKDDTLVTINIPSKKFRYYKKFVDNNAEYKRFIGSNKKQIDLWELKEDNADSHKDLTSLTTLKDMVVLLYIEAYSKDGDLCTKLNCDNQGIEQIGRLRVLLVSAKNAKYIASKDTIYKKHNWYELYKQLPEVSVKRVVLNCDNTKEVDQLKLNYYNAIKTNNTLTNLTQGIDSIFSKFGQTSISYKINTIFNLFPNAVASDFQYRYDVLKDLVDTYNELKSLLLHLNVECCPNIGSFPKHLMLGKVEELKSYHSLRHQFYKSPIIGVEDQNFKKAMSLLKRIKLLAFNWNSNQKSEGIKITPSQQSGELGNKAIPFYYTVNDPMLKQWSFEKYSNLDYKLNLSYHRENLEQIPLITNPLAYNLDPYNFYRIEGHQGKDKQLALDTLLKRKKDFGLNFDIKLLSVDTASKTINITEYKCHFEDLSILLEAWKVEQSCVLSEISKFFSGFSTTEAGTNIVSKRDGYERIKNVVADIAKATDPTSGVSAISGISSMRAARGMETIASFGEMKKSLPKRKIYRKQSDLAGRINIVKEDLTSDEDTLGVYMKRAIEENEKGSANDIMAHFNNNTSEIAASENWKADNNLAEFILKDIPTTLAYTYILDNRIPDRLVEIDHKTLTQYKLTIDQLCRYVKNLQTKYKNLDKIEEGSKQIMGLLINQLSTVCCSAKKLEILLKEIEKRKKEILLQIQLSEFVKKHPGLEHKAGVSPGGTFVMVYLTDDEKGSSVYEDTILEIEFLEQPNIDDEGLDGDEGVIKLWNDKLSTKFAFLHQVSEETQNPLDEVVIIGQTIEDTVENFSEFLNRIWKRAGQTSVQAKAEGQQLVIKISGRPVEANSLYIQFSNPAIVGENSKIFFNESTVVTSKVLKKNTVIADFCLPYMCCSDCTPINFMVPKEPVVLKLPQPYICLKKGTEVNPIPFEASPDDVIIAAEVPENVPSGLTKDENGKYVFDASLTDSSLYGKEIHFTGNGEKTDCKITVYPDFQVAVTSTVEYDTAKTKAKVTYLVSGQVPGLIWAWDYGNGTTSNQAPNEKGIVIVEYTLPVNDTNTIHPTLLISNGFCEATVPMESITFDNPISVSLSIQNTYCLDREGEIVKIPFTDKEPKTGTIAIAEGEIGGLQIIDDVLMIDPIKFNDYDRLISFTVDGIPTSATIIIRPKIQVDIVQDPAGFAWEGDQLNQRYFLGARFLEDINEDTLKYLWTIDGKTAGTERSLNHRFPVNKGTNSYTVELTVVDKDRCTATKTITVSIAYPKFVLRMPNGAVEYCLNDRGSYAIAISPSIFGTKVDGLGVSQTTTGDNEFSPARTNLTSAGNVNLSIAGDNLLTLALKQAPKANASAKVENGELILTNLSDIADSYVWSVENRIITRTNRATVRIKTSTIDSDVVTISLITSGLCGEDTFVIRDFRIRDGAAFTGGTGTSNAPCMEETAGQIKEDNSRLPVNADLIEDLRNRIVLPTFNLYKIVMARPDQFLQGTSNRTLTGMTKLFIDTSNEILKNSRDPYVSGILSDFYQAQIKLFFNILHCQSHEVLEKDSGTILRIFKGIEAGVKRLKSRRVQFDGNDELKRYLIAYSDDAQVISFIKSRIKTNVLPQIL